MDKNRLETATYVAEKLRSKLRDDVIALNPERSNPVPATQDAVCYMLSQIKKTGSPGEQAFPDPIDLSPRLNKGVNTQAKTPLAPTTAPLTAVAVPDTRSHAAVDPQPVAVVAPLS